MEPLERSTDRLGIRQGLSAVAVATLVGSIAAMSSLAIHADEVLR